MSIAYRKKLSPVIKVYVTIFLIIFCIPISVILSFVLFHKIDITIIQIVQSMIITTQMALLYVQLRIMSRREIPIIVLEHSRTNVDGIIDREPKYLFTAIINVKNLTDNPALRIKLEVNLKSGKKIDDEIEKNIKCDIVEYLGPREEREMCRIVEPHKFAEVVDIVKISYLDADGNSYEMVFSVNGKDVNGKVKLSFIPIPQKHLVYI